MINIKKKYYFKGKANYKNNYIYNWGLAQSPIPNPQSPIPNPQKICIFNKLIGIKIY